MMVMVMATTSAKTIKSMMTITIKNAMKMTIMIIDDECTCALYALSRPFVGKYLRGINTSITHTTRYLLWKPRPVDSLYPGCMDAVFSSVSYNINQPSPHRLVHTDCTSWCVNLPEIHYGELWMARHTTEIPLMALLYDFRFIF